MPFYILLSFTFFYTSIAYALNRDFLIDFSEYNENIKQGTCCLEKDPDFEKKYQQSLEIIEKNPYKSLIFFENVYEDFFLENWIFINSLDQKKQSINQDLLLKYYSNLSETLKPGFYFSLFFNQSQKEYQIKPMYKIYPYDKKGYPIGQKTGIIHNLNSIDDISKISLRLGLLAKDYKKLFNISLQLRNFQGDLFQIPLSSFYFRESGFKRYYQRYENELFQNQIDKKQLGSYQSYYVVFYEQKDKKPYAFQFYKDGKLSYLEIELVWNNNSFLSAKNRDLSSFKKTISPDYYPYFAFDQIILSKNALAEKKQTMHFFIYNIQVQYLPYLSSLEEKAFFEDFNTFPIFKEKAKKMRKQMELDNSDILFSSIEKAFSQGIVLFEDFLDIFQLQFRNSMRN